MQLVVNVSILLFIILTPSATISNERLRRHRRHEIEKTLTGIQSEEVFSLTENDEETYDAQDYRLSSIDESAEEKNVLWQNPEHPERRPGRYIGEEQTEFVRTEHSEQIYQKMRTYSTGAAPRQIDCFSCMSLSYQTSWRYLQATYMYPKIFTDRCRDPSSERGMPTVGCSSVCVSLMEPEIEAGVFIGFKHIRGCLDKVLRSGFNQSALRTHRFQQNNHCRTLSRASLFNPAHASDPPAIGDVQLCSCYGDRCNSSINTNKSMIFTCFVAIIMTASLLFYEQI